MTPTLRYSLEYAYREEERPMMTVNQVSKLTGVSIRTLQYYDTIGLLKPIKYTESGYRLYDDTALERLQQILLFKELEFSLKEIKEIIDAPNFDRAKALEQQIELLTLKKEHLENLIDSGFVRASSFYVCEIKFSSDEFIIDKEYDLKLRNKMEAFKRNNCYNMYGFYSLGANF